MERVKPGVTPELKTAMGAPKAPSYLVSYHVVQGYGAMRFYGSVVVTTEALTKAQTHPGNPQQFLDDVIAAAYASGDLERVNLNQRGAYLELLPGLTRWPLNGQTIFRTDDPNYTKTPRQA
jgi:hypothetical protein